jgi:hypothetical protein
MTLPLPASVIAAAGAVCDKASRVFEHYEMLVVFF